MGISTGSGYCPYCRAGVMVACPTSLDVVHLVLTLLTGGLWGLIWWYCRRYAPVCACCQCGRKLPRRRLQVGWPSLWENPWQMGPAMVAPTEFNSFLVARNLVYYVPTSARYRHT